MAFPLALIPVAISAIQSLVKFRDRVDVIVSTAKASEPIPLLLPPVPLDLDFYTEGIEKFLLTDKGADLAALHNLQDARAEVLAEMERRIAGKEPAERNDNLFHDRHRLFELYFTAEGISPKMEGPEGETSPTPDPQRQLALFLIESHRLSRNPAVTRILLATADTVLEVAGANAGLFISNPKTRSVVESVLQNFAGEQDFDDQSTDRIFKRLLSATVVAALDTPGIVPDQPALKPFLQALADVRKGSPDGDDLVATLITNAGFEKLLSSFLGHVAEDPSFITNDELTRKVLAATLTEGAKKVTQLREYPKALLGVLEAGLKAGAADVGGILERELAGKPLLAAMAQNVAKTVAESPAPFRELAQGELFVAIYKTALGVVSTNPALFGDDAKTQALAGALVSALNDAVDENNLHDLFTSERLEALLTEGVALVAAHPELLGRGDPAALEIMGAAFQSGASATTDGRMSQSDLMEIAAAALRTAAANGRDGAFAGKLSEVLRVAGSALGDPQITAVMAAKTRKELLVLVVEAAAANPKVWGSWADGHQLKPLLGAVIKTLAADPADVLGSANLNAAIRIALVQIARRGSLLVDGKITVPQLSALLSLALQGTDEQIGVTLDRDSAPLFFESILVGYLRQPFIPQKIGAPEFQALVSAALAHLEPT